MERDLIYLLGELLGPQILFQLRGKVRIVEKSLMIGLERSNNNSPGSFKGRAWRFRLLFLVLGFSWGPLMILVGKNYYCQVKLFQAALQRDWWFRLILPCELSLIKVIFYILVPSAIFWLIGIIARISLKCPHCSAHVPIFTTLSLPDKCKICQKTLIEEK